MFKYFIILYFFTILQLTMSSPESRTDPGQLNIFEEAISYDVESTVLLNELERKDKEVSYKIKAKLNVLPVWRDPGVESLLKFELLSPHLLSRGKSVTADYLPVNSMWYSHSHSTFYAHWNLGRIERAYLDPADPKEIQNFKRALIGAFQFQAADTETDESDVSGACRVQYETFPDNVIRKYKSGCVAAGWAQGGARSRRVARYTLDSARRALLEVRAEELHELPAGAPAPGLKARALLQLVASGAPRSVPAAASLADALGALPAGLVASELRPAPVDVLDPLYSEESAELEIAAALEEAPFVGLGAAAGGEPGEPAAPHLLRRMLRAVRAAPPRALAELLHDRRDPAHLSAVCTALGLAGAAHTHAAAARFLRLRARDAPLGLARDYLAALAQAPEPEASVVEDVLRLGEELDDPELAESALLAGAAAAVRLPGLAAAARDSLAGSLARCKSDGCRRVRIAALGNLRREDTAELLLEHAEGEARDAALAALGALDGLLPALRPDARRRRLERLALRPRPLELRAAALDLVLRCSAEAPFGLPPFLFELYAAAPPDLLRLAWDRLSALAEEHPPVRDVLDMVSRRLPAWRLRAATSTSSVLVRSLGAARGWGARLESVQVASGGVLRRGRVSLRLVASDNVTDDTLSVELWTRGLEALAGSGAWAEEGEEARGGLELDVGGARWRGVTLFAGQSELLGHVWAGTAGSPTAVLRGARAAGGRAAGGALPLLDGAALRYERDALGSLALDAAAQVSLWSRNARSQLEMRAAGEAQWGARVAAAGATLQARGSLRADGQLRVEADLDFYDGNTLCVRARVEDYEYGWGVRLSSAVGPREVRRSRDVRVPLPGRTLSLGRVNDALCCVLTPVL